MKKEKCSNAVKWGLAGGTFLALIHLAWTAFVASAQTSAQQFVSWKIAMHMLSVPVTVKAFDIGSAITLLVLAFVWGFVLGWLLEKIVELIWKKC